MRRGGVEPLLRNDWLFERWCFLKIILCLDHEKPFKGVLEKWRQQSLSQFQPVLRADTKTNNPIVHISVDEKLQLLALYGVEGQGVERNNGDFSGGPAAFSVGDVEYVLSNELKEEGKFHGAPDFLLIFECRENPENCFVVIGDAKSGRSKSVKKRVKEVFHYSTFQVTRRNKITGKVLSSKGPSRLFALAWDCEKREEGSSVIPNKIGLNCEVNLFTICPSQGEKSREDQLSRWLRSVVQDVRRELLKAEE